MAKMVATVRMYIPAGKASPSPPLGPALGQVSLYIEIFIHLKKFDIHDYVLLYLFPSKQKGVNIGAFCKEFNEKTNHIKEGIDLPVRIAVMVRWLKLVPSCNTVTVL